MNLKNAFLSLEKYFSPKITGEVNDQYIKVVKIKGQEVPWHIHENEDELFCHLALTILPDYRIGRYKSCPG
jgi:allantoicase